MIDADPLVTAYVASFPDEAAVTFAALTTDQAVALWKTLPEALAASLLNRVPTQLRDDIIAKSNPARLAACINKSDSFEGLRIVQGLPQSRRDDVMNRVDQNRRARLEKTARQQQGSVGSAMSTNLVRLSMTMRVDKALAHIRGSKIAGPICVLDADGHLAGTVEPEKLLASEQSESVATLVERVNPLSASMRLANAASDTQWRTRLWLPVADRNRRLLGVLMRDRLDHASGQALTQQAAAGMTPVVTTFVSTMSQVIATLLGGRSR